MDTSLSASSSSLERLTGRDLGDVAVCAQAVAALPALPVADPGDRYGPRPLTMASDHYTPIHNWILRGGLPAPYVGVYAYIASHREGWRLSEAQIARDLHRGRHYVRQALTAMEAAGLLVRRQERRADGTYGAALWWVSDLAAQLRSLGVDEETISRRVAEAADDCFRRSAPMSENLTSAVSSGNTPPGGVFPQVSTDV